MPKDISEIKVKVSAVVTDQRQAAVRLSREIHANPELGFEEARASGLICDYLSSQGFKVTRGLAGLETAFRADYGDGPPTVGLMAEYDALPEIGHACGHNLIAAGSSLAAVAAKVAVDAAGGRVSVFGTPGEEGGGGKIIMAEAGAFKDLDAAMMVHPGVKDIACPRVLAARTVRVEYFGQAAHASADPEQGINALEAMLLAFNAINSLRQHIPESARIHGIITDGGQAPNIVPAYTAGNFMVRALDNDYLEKLAARVIKCFQAGATATGARLEYKWIERHYAALVSNRALAGLFADNMATLGREYRVDAPGEKFGSTDMGNISLLVPSIHPLVAIAAPGLAIHSPDFCRAAVSEAAVKGMLDAATGLALTATDLIADADKLAAVKAEFMNSEDLPHGG